MPIDASEYEYAGFWIRVWAALIDTVLILFVTLPLLGALYGWDYAFESSVDGGTFRPTEFAITWLLPAIAVLVFWRYRSATPGKMVIGARIVDATTGEPPSTWQLIGRYLGYYVSSIPLCLGLIWVGFDRRKQGWHDKLANTVVIRSKRHGTEPVHFR
ncbi:MAG TPA: RDD family protein [Caldimonas sp.]